MSRRKGSGEDDSQLGFSFEAPPPERGPLPDNVILLPLPERRPPKPAPPREVVEPPAAPEGAVALPEGLRLERNLALLAGAGAGKTYSLVTICLHVLSGARANRLPVECAGLGLLTFTEKASAEMRGRLRARLDDLAEGRGDEAELRASFEALDQPMPDAASWRRIRDELGAATISTFHALCTQLLRRAPAGSGVNPNVELLDERASLELLEGVVQRVVLEQVQAGNASVRQLVRDLGFGGGGQWGLVDALVPVVRRLREEGLSPRYLPVANAEQLRARFDEALTELRDMTRLAFANAGKHRDALSEFSQILEGTSFQRWPDDQQRLWELTKRKGPLKDLGDRVRPTVKELSVAQRSHHLGLLYGAALMAPHEEALRQVLSLVMERHREVMERRGVVDFTALLIQSRDLLRDFPEARREAQARFQALLVDEFQDTNRLQLELVLMLAEQREGAGRPVSQVLEGRHPELERELPLEPGFLAVVGDRKQAIYEFRGADVSVFEVMAQAIERSGGGRAFLQDSRRSSPQLVKVLNTLMPRVLGLEKYVQPLEDFEVVYQPQTDDLRAVRPASPDDTPLVTLTGPSEDDWPEDAEAMRLADADAVARAVAELVHRGEYQVVPRREGAPTRTIRGGDVALLFQRFTQVEVYRQALVRFGVRHRVIRGRGFYAAQEVVDVASLLRLVSDPLDALSLAAVLRSPMVGLTDTALVRFALPREGEEGLKLRPERVWDQGAWPEGLSSEEQARLARFRDCFHQLHAERDRLGLRALLRVAFERLSLRVVVAGGPYGEQALANLDKLLELATQREARGVGVAAFSRELWQLADTQPTEAQGEVVDEQDLEAVTLCTVHQAKGLEWPVVVLPDLSTQLNNRDKAVRFDRALGIALRPPTADGDLESLNAKEIDERNKRRARAESLRLLYVALTRARDRIMLGLMPAKPHKGTWASELGLHQQWNDLQIVPWQPPAQPASAPADPEWALPEARQYVQAALDRVRYAGRPTSATAVLPVTQLQDFVTCPRLFHFAHQLSLAERRGQQGPVSRPDSGEGDDLEVDVRTRGTAAHRLLELTALDQVGTVGLAAHLRELQRLEGLQEVGDAVPEWVRRFWTTPFGRRLGTLGDARVHRELPFLLTLRDGDFRLALKGQIDLLVEEDGEVLVVDYKTSVPSRAGLEPYRFQLGCYLLAAQRFINKAVPLRAGIVYLRHQELAPFFLDAPMDLAVLERSLVAEARALTRAQSGFQWLGRERPTCETLGCGYVYRCHP